MNNFKDLSKHLKKIEKDLEDKLGEKLLKKIGDNVLKKIKHRWITGQGVSETGGSKKPLKKLSPISVVLREDLKEKGKLSNLTKPDKSNLISSGDTYNSLSYEVKDESVEIGIDEANAYKITDNENRNRKMLYLSKEELEIIDKLIEDEIDKILK